MGQPHSRRSSGHSLPEGISTARARRRRPGGNTKVAAHGGPSCLNTVRHLLGNLDGSSADAGDGAATRGRRAGHKPRERLRKGSDERMTADEPRDDSARPVPRPGPRPGPRPVSSGSRPAAHPVLVPPPPSNPYQFGRVDDDGTVWLISAAGERIIGSWQAGDRDAAFAHFGRRFDDLATEVTLMEERLASGTGDARKIKVHAAELAETLP